MTATNHSSQLLDSGLILKGLKHAQGSLAHSLFVNSIVGISKGGYLGKMGNAYYLMIPSQSPQLFADYLATAPPHTNINLIENKHRNMVGFTKRPL